MVHFKKHVPFSLNFTILNYFVLISCTKSIKVVKGGKKSRG